MRLFTAIDIPAAVKDKLRALLDRIRPLAAMKWSPVENLHITTKFIGEWPEPRLDEMKGALAGAATSGPLELAIRGLGWFPNPVHPRVFWVGVEGGDPLASLANATALAVSRIGVPVEDRPYSPHLTLGRIKDRIPLDALRAAMTGVDSNFGSFRAVSFSLYLSAGGKYTKLAGLPL